MKGYAWFLLGAAAASVGWLFVAAWLCDQRDAAERRARRGSGRPRPGGVGQGVA